VLIAIVTLYLGLLTVAPLVAIAVDGFGEGALVLARKMLSPEALGALSRSLLVTAIAVVFHAVAGTATALVLVRQRFVGSRLLDILVDMPLAVSPVMTGLAFIILLGRGGWLSPVLDALHLKVLFSLPGMVLATLFVTLPFVVREVSNVLKELGTEEEEAAATLGASRLACFWRITLPNIRSALTFGVTLTAARSLGEFGAVLILGGSIAGQTDTATTFVYASVEERDPISAAGMSLVLACLSSMLLLALQALKRKKEKVSWASK
jgi:sulfate transport system permease protein